MSEPGRTPVRFSVRLPQAHCCASPDALVAIGSLADELGFWGVSAQDHVIANQEVSTCGESHDPRGDDRNVFEALQTLAFVGAHTETVRLVTGVLVTPFRHAVLLAKELASLDQFTGGRLIVGVGVGAPTRGTLGDEDGQTLTGHALVARQEFEAFGIQGHRGTLADESLQAMAALWSDGPAAFRGRHYEFEGLEVLPKPRQRPRPPIWVGGRSEAARRRAMRYADGWFPSQISPQRYAEGVAWMRAFAAETGLAMPTDHALNIFAAVDEDGDRARAVNARTFGHRFTPEWLSQVTFGGSPDDVVAQIQAFVDCGVNVIDLKLVPPTLEHTRRQLRLLADEVLPAFADR